MRKSWADAYDGRQTLDGGVWPAGDVMRMNPSVTNHHHRHLLVHRIDAACSDPSRRCDDECPAGPRSPVRVVAANHRHMFRLSAPGVLVGRNTFPRSTPSHASTPSLSSSSTAQQQHRHKSGTGTPPHLTSHFLAPHLVRGRRQRGAQLGWDRSVVPAGRARCNHRSVCRLAHIIRPRDLPSTSPLVPLWRPLLLWAEAEAGREEEDDGRRRCGALPPLISSHSLDGAAFAHGSFRLPLLGNVAPPSRAPA